MKSKIKRIALVAGCCLATWQISAQSAEDVLRFSRYNQGFGTARSAAMGGAFSSLGADLSVLSLNPAGLGMYRRSEIGISPSFTSAQVETSLARERMARSRLSLNNIGAAFNIYNGGGTLTSVTFGFAYNKMVDLNFHSNVFEETGNTTRLDIWGRQLGNTGVVPPTNPDETLNPNDFYVDEWGAVNAYNSRMIRYDGSVYNTDNLFDQNTRFSYDYLRKNKGSVGQYDISAGFNLLNKFYFGAGLGMQDLSYNQHYTFDEYADNNGTNDLDSYRYATHLDQSGSAWNFKFGVIARPVEELRLALAFHTPTYIDIEERYMTSTDAFYHNYQDEWAQIELDFVDEYNMRTPPRLILGASYIFFNTAILSLDYERVWYNKLRVFRNRWEDEDRIVTDQARNWFRPTNNLRVGLETRLAENIFGRVGYAFHDSHYKNSNLRKYAKVSNYSTGVGYRTADWGIDLAYIYMDSQDAPDWAYIAEFSDLTIQSSAFTARNRRHNITATFSYRF
jgi:hypothetical protein